MKSHIHVHVDVTLSDSYRDNLVMSPIVILNYAPINVKSMQRGGVWALVRQRLDAWDNLPVRLLAGRSSPRIRKFDFDQNQDFCTQDIESYHLAAAWRMKLWLLNADLFFKEPH